MTTHSFDVGDASQYGVDCAILLYNLRFWIFYNWTNSKHQVDGRTWTFNSAKAYAQQFPYLSEDKIQRLLTKLTDAQIILRRAGSMDKWDRTNWYAFVDQDAQLAPMIEAAQHSAKLRNASRKAAESTPHNRGIDAAKLRNHCTDVNTDVIAYKTASPRIDLPLPRESGGSEASRAAIGEAMAVLRGKIVTAEAG
ncbi:hypothetical protein [Paraburkholderia domus]|uniref:hypothetical protein n=1 Tax=Paraburkholderia domus TaxID=2793075 RepID=UPI001B15CA3C|nr:hypothetical protein [Paraburkholderia domus]CAE6835046.1 hypothetical protein R75483_06878 [Paraburkholderia domus]